MGHKKSRPENGGKFLLLGEDFMTPIFVMIFVFSLVYLLTGYLVKKHHSEFPDTFCGYHAGHLAQKNESTWTEANLYAGNFLMRASLINIGLNLIILFAYILYNSWNLWLAVLFNYLIIAVLLPIILLLIFTERHLKKLFHEDGRGKI